MFKNLFLFDDFFIKFYSQSYRGQQQVENLRLKLEQTSILELRPLEGRCSQTFLLTKSHFLELLHSSLLSMFRVPILKVTWKHWLIWYCLIVFSNKIVYIINTACPIIVMLTIRILESVKYTAKIQGNWVFIINFNYIYRLCTKDKTTFDSQCYGGSLKNNIVGFITKFV